MDRFIRPAMGGSREGAIHETRGTANIKMRILGPDREDGVELDSLPRIAAVVMKNHVVAEDFLDLFHKGRLAGAFGAIVQRRLGADLLQAVAHREDRCDADAAGNQDMFTGIFVERKIVQGWRCTNRIAFL